MRRFQKDKEAGNWFCSKEGRVNEHESVQIETEDEFVDQNDAHLKSNKKHSMDWEKSTFLGRKETGKKKDKRGSFHKCPEPG